MLKTVMYYLTDNDVKLNLKNIKMHVCVCNYTHTHTHDIPIIFITEPFEETEEKWLSSLENTRWLEYVRFVQPLSFFS